MIRKKKVKTAEPKKEVEIITTEEGIELDSNILTSFKNHLDDSEFAIQSTFNTTKPEELNDPDSIIENVNASEDIEGIGATGFTVRTTKPSNNKNYITQSAGGYSTCIVGNPTDPNANVLSNCVGYASGRFNEIINLCRGTNKFTYPYLNCNAENFIERAQAAGLKIGTTPKVGAIICWQCGPTLSGSDGAGHVEVVEKINSDGSIYTSSSAYGGTAFYNVTRYNSNGRWGISSNYSFRGFIYQPTDVQTWIDGSTIEVTPNVKRDTTKNQIEVKIDDLRVRTNAHTTANIIGYAHKGFYNTFDSVVSDGYTWYRIAENQWIASNPEWSTVYPKEVPKLKYSVGNRVLLNGTLYEDADGNNPGETVHNVVTTITRTAPGKKCPYNTTGDLGWVYESALTLYKEESFKVGDKVVPIKLVSYTGTPLKQYDKYYTISELHGDRAILVARGQIWAPVNIKNLKHYN